MTDTVLSHPGPDEPVIDPETGEAYTAEGPFIVDNDRKATWAMRKLLEHQQEVAGIISIAEAEIARIQQWADEQAAKHSTSIAYFEAQLTRYAATVREESGGKVKSISTPYGKVTSRAGTDKWVIDDEAFLDWARETHPDWIRTVEQRAVDVPTLKTAFVALPTGDGVSAVTPDGDIVPGISIVPGETSFKVEVAK